MWVNPDITCMPWMIKCHMSSLYKSASTSITWHLICTTLCCMQAGNRADKIEFWNTFRKYFRVYYLKKVMNNLLYCLWCSAALYRKGRQIRESTVMHVERTILHTVEKDQYCYIATSKRRIRLKGECVVWWQASTLL